MMITEEKRRKIIEALQKVPTEIREWMGSDELTELNEHINSDLKLPEDKQWIVSYLLLRLQTKDLKPEDFYDTLIKNLEISDSDAKKTIKVIKETALNPIKTKLKDWGVEIDMIKTNESDEKDNMNIDIGTADIKLEESKKPEATEISKEEVPAGAGKSEINVQKAQHSGMPESPKEEVQKPKDENPAVIDSVKKNEESVNSDNDVSSTDEIKPFVIHEQESQEKTGGAKGVNIKKGFSFSLGKAFSDRTPKEKKAPKARVEAPGKEEPKVVHYSEHRSEPEIKSFSETSDIKNDSSSQKTLKTSKDNDTTVAPKIETQHSGMPDSPKDNDENGPTLKGNEVDLR